MKAVRILLALVLTIGLLYIARTTSRGRPEFVTHTENGFTFAMTTVPKVFERELGRIEVKITGPFEKGIRPVFRGTKPGQTDSTALRFYSTIPLWVADSTEGIYYMEITAGDRGGKLWYFFEIRDNTGGLRARFLQPNGKPFLLKYIGHVPAWVLIGHIFLMFTTVFFVVLGGLTGLSMMFGNNQQNQLSKYFLFAVIASFLGGYPFGFMMNYYAFGTIWEGVPFGTDATDNKTQLLFVYLLFVLFIGIGSLTRGTLGKDLYSPKVRGFFGFSALVLLIAIYLIPHSIQFSPMLTYTVCYSFIAFVVLLYVLGWVVTNRQNKKKQRAPEIQ